MRKKYAAAALGEIMLRLASPVDTVLSKEESLVKYAAGAELNVMAGISELGLETAILSALPDNLLSGYILAQTAACGVSRDGIALDSAKNARVGLYFSQSGAYPRKPTVVYDRANSSFSRLNPENDSCLPFEILEEASLFHTTGITLALGENIRKIAKTAMERAKNAGALISFDVNYRASLWGEEEAKTAIEELLPMVDILFISEESCRRMFKMQGELAKMQQSFCDKYGISKVFSTMRRVVSASNHSFGSCCFSTAEGEGEGEATSKPYDDIQVVDRIGSGDAFVAGALFGLLKTNNCKAAMDFGNAMAAYKSTVNGDLLMTSYKEIAGIVENHHSNQPQSEMNR